MTTFTEPGSVHGLRIERGSLHMTRVFYDRYLHGVDSVALLEHDGQLLMMPVQGSATGGLLLKVRNARGDRVVHATEFLVAQGLERHHGALRADWNDVMAGLVLQFDSATEHS